MKTLTELTLKLREAAKADLAALLPEEIFQVTHPDPRMARFLAAICKHILVKNFDLLSETLGADISHEMLTGERTHEGRDRLLAAIREGKFET